MSDVSTERVPTGIPGLDPLLEGGFLRGGVYMLQGAPGAGKTIFGNQACFAHAAAGGRAVYITLLAETHTRMLSHMRRMSFYKQDLIPEQLYFLSAFKVLENDGLAGLLTALRKEVTGRDASLLVLDGLVSAEEASPSPKEFKKFVHELQIVCAMTNCTALLLSSTERPRPFRPEHTMVDGIIELGDELHRLRSVRFLQVRKMRGTAAVQGRHTIEISDDGLVVRPRFETRLVNHWDAAPGAEERMGFGIEELDRMLCGGLPACSNTMVLGPTGAGKTTLGLQFLADGASRGEPGVYFGFYERPSALLERSRRLKLGFDEINGGPVEFVWHRPVEGVIDVLGERLIETLRRRKARRLFLDGMAGLELAVESPERMRDVFAALADELARAGVTTVYSMETPDLVGPTISVPVSGVSAITHNIIMVRHVEMDARLYRLLSILKLRDSDYDAGIREFRITDSGLDIVDTFDDAERILTGSAHNNGDKPGAGRSKPPTKRRPPPR